ncbi:uncharacterized protein LOC131878646 [Tigriopus californicus]|uniref:uncharacterized protein LOC131878646 n=1 Tax=Tigriopus californicus TaxID=6832 RepID=UPI0027D9F96D|nr:uncharacterized protein LOC131878646 [Tigriopus californicus]
MDGLVKWALVLWIWGGNESLGRVTVTCRDFWTTTSNFAPYVHAVRDGSQLKGPWINADAKLLSLNVINGTLWLNLGGSLNQFEPVIGTPPSSSSQFTLKQVMENAIEHWSPRGFVVNYLPSSLFECEHLSSYSKDIPIWVSQESGIHGCGLGLNHMMDKPFALDSSIKRLLDEDILLKNDRTRVLDILNDFFTTKVAEADVRYLRTMYSRQSESTRQSFTDLFLQNLLHLVDNTRSGPKGSPLDPLAFLPDLRETGSTYSASDFQSVRKSLASRPNECHLVSLRAGILETGESISAVKKVLDEHENVIVLAFAKAYDITNGQSLKQIQQMLGQDRVLIQSSSDLEADFPEISPSLAPNPRKSGALPTWVGSQNAFFMILMIYFSIGQL